MRRLLGIILSLTALGLSAQPSYRLGWLPQINQNFPLAQGWRLNAQLEARPWVAQSHQGGPEPQAGYRLTDLSGLVVYSMGPLKSLAAGYLLRHTPGSWHHRTIQQYTWVQPQARLRLGHRLAADQTFGQARPPEWRLRYRLALEIPLKGRSVDPGEWYFKGSQEMLHAWQLDQYDLEFRLVPTLGYVMADGNKLELGLDYRLDGFLLAQTRHTGFGRLSWYRKW